MNCLQQLPSTTARRYVCACLVLTLCLVLQGCDNRQKLEGGLDAKESIEMMVVLNRAGISAERVEESGAGNKYKVAVFPRDLNRSFAVLSEFALPRKSTETIDACVAPQGFAPNRPEMTSMRLDRALELRIEQVLSRLPGVISANVVVRAHLGADHPIPATVSEMSSAAAGSAPGAVQGPSASVVLRYGATDGTETFDVGEVKRIVAQSVPNLAPEQVLVQAMRSQLELKGGPAGIGELVQLPLFNFRVPREDRVIAGLNILIVVVCICLAGLVIGAAWSTRSFRKRLLTRARTTSGEHSRSIFIEAQMNQSDSTRGKLPPVRQVGQNE